MIIQCDFDGTITTNNIGLLLREKFAIGDWRKIDSDYLCGRLTVEESNKRQYALIKEPRQKLVTFARENAQVRAGFLELVDYCRATGIRFVIVSSGLDFYIEAVLNKISVPDLELHCARTSFSQDGITISYTGSDGSTVTEGFKKKYLDWLKCQGECVTYIGDGLSDLEAARAADRVFATNHLHRLLSAEAISHYTFSDLHDILRQIRHR